MEPLETGSDLLINSVSHAQSSLGTAGGLGVTISNADIIVIVV